MTLSFSTAGLLADSINDATATRNVYLLAGALALFGVGLIVITVWFWRTTRHDPELLAPLETMGQRRFRRVDESTQQQLLDRSRPADAQPMRWGVVRGVASAEPEIDLRATLRQGPVGYDDLRDPFLIALAREEVDEQAVASTVSPTVAPSTVTGLSSDTTGGTAKPAVAAAGSGPATATGASKGLDELLDDPFADIDTILAAFGATVTPIEASPPDAPDALSEPVAPVSGDTLAAQDTPADSTSSNSASSDDESVGAKMADADADAESDADADAESDADAAVDLRAAAPVAPRAAAGPRGSKPGPQRNGESVDPGNGEAAGGVPPLVIVPVDHELPRRTLRPRLSASRTEGDDADEMAEVPEANAGEPKDQRRSIDPLLRSSDHDDF